MTLPLGDRRWRVPTAGVVVGAYGVAALLAGLTLEPDAAYIQRVGACLFYASVPLTAVTLMVRIVILSGSRRRAVDVGIVAVLALLGSWWLVVALPTEPVFAAVYAVTIALMGCVLAWERVQRPDRKRTRPPFTGLT